MKTRITKLILLLALAIAPTLAFAGPTISNTATVASTSGTVTITWTTSTASTSQVLYGLGGSLSQQTVKSGALVTSHSVTITGLQSGAVYSYAASSTDAANSNTQGPTQTFALCSFVGAGLTQTIATIRTPYEYGTATLTLVNNSGSMLSPTVCGSAVTTPATSQLDLNGNLSVTVPDNNYIIPGPSEWTIAVESFTGTGGPIGAASITTTVTGAQTDLSTLLQAAVVGQLQHVLYDPSTAAFNPPITGTGGGTVTSITAGAGLTATPNPIIDSGTISALFQSLTTTGTSGPATLAAGVLNIPQYSGGSGAVSSVANSDGTLTISPTTGSVIASLALGHANTWTALQTFGTDISIGGVTATGATGTGNVVFSISPSLTGTPDASGAAEFKLPVAASFVTLANGEVGYDTTNKNWHVWQNGADVLLAPLAAGFTSGHCGQPTSSAGTWQFADAGAACGTGSGANTALSNLSAVAVNTALLPGTDNSISVDGLSNRYINSWWSGVVGWTNGSGTADTGLSRGGAGIVDVGTGAAGNAGGTLNAATLNASAALNVGSPGSITCPSGTTCVGYGENSTSGFAGASGTDAIAYDGILTQISLNNGTPYTPAMFYPLQGTDSKVLTSGTISGTGAQLCTDSSGGATTSGCTAGGVASITGDGTLFANSASTGPVTLVAAAALAHSVYGVTGNSAAFPAFTSTPAVTSVALEGSTSGSALLSVTSTGGTLNLGSTNATVTTAGALTVTSCSGCGSVSLSFPLTVSGTTTSGGVPYFSSATVLTSSAVLAANALVVGGGTAGAPATGDGDFTYATHTLTGGASGLVDFSAIATTAGLKVPVGAGAVPTADGFMAVNSTTHAHVWGSNGTTIVGAAAATGTGTATTCTNQFISAVSAVAIPTCSTVANAALSNSAITIAGTSVSLGGSTSSLPSPGAIGGTTPAAITGTTITANTSLTDGGLTTANAIPKNSSAGLFSESSIVDNATTIASPEPVVLGTATCTTFGTAGGICPLEGSAPTNVSGAAPLYPDSTAHEYMAKTNGSSSPGMMNRTQPGAIRSTGLTGSVSTATLCAASAGACNTAGTYRVHVALYQGGVACTTNTTGGVSVQLTWTDGNGSAHSAITLPLVTNSSLVALTGTMLFNQTASGIATVFGSGDLTIDTNGSIIQYATTYASCSVTGTATYAISAAVTRLQ
jgi:hypothetical protein